MRSLYSTLPAQCGHATSASLLSVTLPPQSPHRYVMAERPPPAAEACVSCVAPRAPEAAPAPVGTWYSSRGMFRCCALTDCCVVSALEANDLLAFAFRGGLMPWEVAVRACAGDEAEEGDGDAM